MKVFSPLKRPLPEFIVFVAFFVLAVTKLSAQVPQFMNYQAVVRDTETSLPIANEAIFFSFEFLEGQNGDILYKEEFSSISSDQNGLVNVRMGMGTPVQGSFSSIDWSAGNIWLRVIADAGTGIRILQDTPFASVPYALYSGNHSSSVPIDFNLSFDADSGNLIFERDGQTSLINLASLINDADADPQNESITFADYNDETGILTIEEGAENSFSVLIPDQVDDADSNPLNELIDSLKYQPNTQILQIFEAGATHEVILTGIMDGDADSDPSNEIQNLNLSSHQLSLSGSSAPAIDLSGYLDNTDSQDLSLTGNDLSISGSSAPAIDLSGYMDNTDSQDLSLTGNELSISGSSAPAIDLSGYLDNTDSQDLSLTGNELSISGSSSAAVDLSGYLDNTDSQDLSLTGSTLSLTGDGTSVDLSYFDNSNLLANHIFIGNASNKATNVQPSGDWTMDNTGVAKVNGIQNIPVSSLAPTEGQVLAYNQTLNQWVPVDPSPAVTTGTSFYSVDPLDFVELTHNEHMDDHNSIKYFNENASFAMLRDAGDIEYLAAPVHLPHGAEIENVHFFLKNNTLLGGIFYSLQRKRLVGFQNTNDIIVSGTSLGILNFHSPMLTATVNNIVDNSQYTYRMIIRFAHQVNDNDVDLSEVLQAIYGATIEYTEN